MIRQQGHLPPQAPRPITHREHCTSPNQILAKGSLPGAFVVSGGLR